MDSVQLLKFPGKEAHNEVSWSFVPFPISFRIQYKEIKI